jgi:hypothetical protein
LLNAGLLEFSFSRLLFISCEKYMGQYTKIFTGEEKLIKNISPDIVIVIKV